MQQSRRLLGLLVPRDGALLTRRRVLDGPAVVIDRVVHVWVRDIGAHPSTRQLVPWHPSLRV